MMPHKLPYRLFTPTLSTVTVKGRKPGKKANRKQKKGKDKRNEKAEEEETPRGQKEK